MTGKNRRAFLKGTVTVAAMLGTPYKAMAMQADTNTFSMFAVIFEVHPREDGYQKYLDTAKELRPLLDDISGFETIERFGSVARKDWILSLSFWSDEAALTEWRVAERHHKAQQIGRDEVFQDYRIRVGQVIHDESFGSSPRIAARRSVYNDPALRKSSLVTILEATDAAPTDTEAEQFSSINTKGKSALLRAWTDEAAAFAYRDQTVAKGRRLRIVEVERDYGMFDRHQAPQYYPAKM